MFPKAKILTLILFGLLFLNLSAQKDTFSDDPIAKLPDENRKLRIGLQFSPNVSWFKANTTGYENQGSTIGYAYGLSFEYFMTKNYLFSTGINILSTAGNISYTGVFLHNSTVVDQKYKLKYIEVPTVLKLRTNEIGYLTYFGQFGVNAAFNFKAKTDYDYMGSINNSDYVNAEINWINLSLVIGGGIEYNISGNTSLILGISYNNGFINQLDSKVNLLDNNGDALIDDLGNPVLSDKNANANLNYIALNIGIYF